MLENSGDFANDYMYLREIIYFHEKVVKLHFQYNGLRNAKWSSTFMYVHQEIIPYTEKSNRSSCR